MSITLHWWIAPIIFFSIAFYFMFRPKSGSFYGPDFGNIGDGIFAIAMLFAGASFVAGHFL